MLKNKLKPANYLYNVLVLTIAFALFGLSPLVALSVALPAALVTGTAMNFIKARGLAFMAVQVEIWEQDIEEQIFKDNQFLRWSFKADEFVNGRAVHIPQSGGAGNVVKNRVVGQGGATVRKRVDTDVLYLIDEYTTDPVLISNAETVELSYDKRNSVLAEDKNALSQTIAEEGLYNWLHDQNNNNSPIPATSILSTTGPIVKATAPGATGYRFGASLDDLQAGATFLINQNRWFENEMNGLMPANMRAQMFPATSLITATYMQSVTPEERTKGYMYKAQGFGLGVRSSVVVVAANGTIKAPGTAGEAGDCEAMLLWYTNAVETAYGQVKMFDQYGNPVYYGDLFSFLCRMGGRARRADFAGMVLIKQGQPTADQITAFLAKQ